MSPKAGETRDQGRRQGCIGADGGRGKSSLSSAKTARALITANFAAGPRAPAHEAARPRGESSREDTCDSTLWISILIKTPMSLRERTRPGLAIIEPCLPSPAKAPPSGSGWLHEIKHDGFRILARRDGAGVSLITRAGNDFSGRFPFIAPAKRSFKKPCPHCQNLRGASKFGRVSINWRKRGSTQ
jgi:ATP-dependent DNA ligase